MAIRIFIVDDHSIVREGLCSLLDIHDNVIVVGDASDGRQAVSLIQQIMPDMVIMDIALPGLNGIEATRQICRKCPSTKVIMLSMFCTSEHIFRAFQAGASGYLLKESAGSELLKAILIVHSGKHYLSEKIAGSVLDDYKKLSAPGRQKKSPLERLSNREIEILQLVVEGKSSAEIGEVLSLSRKSVETYRSRLMHKLEVKGLPALIRFAILNGLSPIE
ncbi:MAG: DNA-binding response regulator [Nitrospirae bacterium GWC2_42_7]|nr:MAG: DNA-binding response regulator [Nitrospirae bacterium GWC2_42_7]